MLMILCGLIWMVALRELTMRMIACSVIAPMRELKMRMISWGVTVSWRELRKPSIPVKLGRRRTLNAGPRR